MVHKCKLIKLVIDTYLQSVASEVLSAALQADKAAIPRIGHPRKEAVDQSRVRKSAGAPDLAGTGLEEGGRARQNRQGVAPILARLR